MSNLSNKPSDESAQPEKQNKPHHVYNLIILDESGSMDAIKGPTIRGFNEVVQTIKAVEEKFTDQKHFISLVSFNGYGIKDVHWNVELGNLSLLDEEMYQPGYSTPLYDAMGRSISRLKETLPSNATFNVFVTVITDGEENASVSFSGAMIKEMIEDLKEKSWTFAYIGANHDVERFASRISIKNTMRYEANEANMNLMWAKEKSARMKMGEYVALMRKSEPIQFNEGLYDEEKES